MKSVAFLVVLLLSISMNAMAALHKWVDTNGKVHYSDSAPPDIKTQKIRSVAENPLDVTNGNSLVPSTKSLAERERDYRKSQQENEENEKKAVLEKEQNEIKRKNCEYAKSDLANLENSPSVITYNEKGERTVIDALTRTKQLEDARKDIRLYCN